jgi:hypothetical protein
MKQAISRRVGPFTGLLSTALVFIGLSIHGYPDIRPTDTQLARWLAGVDPNSFRLGIYIEQLGIVLFLAFAAWLYGHLRRKDHSWVPVAMLAAAAAHVTVTLPLNEIYVGLVDRAGKGLDIHLAQTVIAINQEWFDMTGIVLGLFLVTAGAAMLHGAGLARLAAVATILIGLAQVASSPFGLTSTPAGILPYAWFVAVAVYYTVRPAQEQESDPGAARAAVASGLPATS